MEHANLCVHRLATVSTLRPPSGDGGYSALRFTMFYVPSISRETANFGFITDFSGSPRGENRGEPSRPAITIRDEPKVFVAILLAPIE